MNNDEVSIGDFVKEYSELVTRAHGKVIEEETHDTNAIDDDGGDDGDDDILASEPTKEETPLHFKIVIKVRNSSLASHFKAKTPTPFCGFLNFSAVSAANF